MKKNIQYKINQLNTWQKQVFFASPLHIILIIVVGVLFLATFLASTTSNEGASSVKKLKLYLQKLLQRDMKTLQAEAETYQLEKLINQVKVICEKEAICGDQELWNLIEGVCNKVRYISDEVEIQEKNKWRLFSAIAYEFYTSYGTEKGVTQLAP
jgi:hypothetical protein